MIEELKESLKERIAISKKSYYQQQAYRTALTLLDRLPEPATQQEERLLIAQLHDYATKQAVSHAAQAAADHAFIALFKDVNDDEIEYRVREHETHAKIFQEYSLGYQKLSDMLEQRKDNSD